VSKRPRARDDRRDLVRAREGLGPLPAEIRSISGVYGASYEDDAEWKALQDEIAQFASAQGRRPRILVAKIGQDGHDRAPR
jgi:methylmalonyl-CoA mutase